MGILRYQKCFHEKEIDLHTAAHILLCSDRNVIRGLGVTIVSVLENLAMPCVIHVAFNGELPEEEAARFSRMAEMYDTMIIFYWIDDAELQGLHGNRFITVTAYYRLLMPYVLHAQQIEKCIYLDTDVICVADVSSWYRQDLKAFVAYVVKDATATPGLREKKTCKELGMKGIRYFNAGVMLINIPRYVQLDIGKEALRLCSEHDYGAMDQDVLNIVMEGKVRFDPTYAYNCGMSVRNHEIPDTICFVHFTGGKKPWRLCVSELGAGTRPFGDQRSWRYRYYEAWRKYAAKSLWANIPFALPVHYTEWRYYSTVCLKNGDWLRAIRWYLKYLREKAKS
jgi:lipopolysaccharide biosynthesis glycosyltransferase